MVTVFGLSREMCDEYRDAGHLVGSADRANRRLEEEGSLCLSFLVQQGIRDLRLWKHC
jgi:hypothetical protein